LANDLKEITGAMLLKLEPSVMRERMRSHLATMLEVRERARCTMFMRLSTARGRHSGRRSGDCAK
jgi:hypothetical protein